MEEFYNSSAMDKYKMKAAFFGNEVPGHALVPAFMPTYENPSEYFVGEAPGQCLYRGYIKNSR